MSTTSETSATETMAHLQATLKTLPVSDLFKLIKFALTETEKQTKAAAKATIKATKTTTKKEITKPKKGNPTQLEKPRAWVKYTLDDALANGWESFIVHQKHTDKVTGEKIVEEITMSASVLHEGSYVYEDSVTEKHPAGIQLKHKDAMSLSKQRKESGHPTYAAFEAEYAAREPATHMVSDTESESSATSKVSKVIKLTAAEKEALAEQKREEKKRLKEEEKAKKDAEKASTKKAPVKPQEHAPVESEAKPAQSSPAGAAGLVPQKKTKPAVKAEIPDDGMAHPWVYKGNKYLRNFEGETWTVGADGGVGDWVGLYNKAEDKIDTSAPEPVFEEDDDE